MLLNENGAGEEIIETSSDKPVVSPTINTFIGFIALTLLIIWAVNELKKI